MNWGFAIAVFLVSAVVLAALDVLRDGMRMESPLSLAAGIGLGILAIGGIAVLGRALVADERSKGRR